MVSKKGLIVYEGYLKETVTEGVAVDVVNTSKPLVTQVESSGSTAKTREMMHVSNRDVLSPKVDAITSTAKSLKVDAGERRARNFHKV